MSIRRVVPVEEAEWRIADAPDWVERREPDWSFDASDEYPFSVLLVDEQHDVATHAISFRNVRKFLTHAAVQSLSQVEIEFDPAAHRLLLHDLSLWRQDEGGEWSRRSRAQKEDFLLRQREQQLEQQMLNGRLSLVALLEDVRVGDAVDLSWTLEPREVLPGLRFNSLFTCAWTVPVARAFVSVRPSAEVPVSSRLHVAEGVEAPVERITPEELSWEVASPPPLYFEPNAPGSSWTWPIVDVTAWTSWGEVADFFADLWAEALEEGALDVAAEVADLRSRFSPDNALLEAIRFVQEDVRYLAVDFGHGAGMLPNGAGTVLRRRFGDCKDKSVLLSALLRALGFEAWPMLVAANWCAAVSRVQPSTVAFSHAIVSFVVEGRRYFVDPTFIGQRGRLEQLAAPPYGCGLEVRSGAEELTVIGDLPPTRLSVVETFELDRRGQSRVEQVMTARGTLADNIRATLLRDGEAAFSKARAENLKSTFPALSLSEENSEIRDDTESGEIEILTRFDLPTWGPTGQKPPAVFDYGAHGLFYAVESLEGPEERRQPWALRHPLSAHHRVVVHGPCVRRVKTGKQEFSGPGFRYTCRTQPRDDGAIFDYDWETTQDEVSPTEWPSYCAERARALNEAGGLRVVTNKRLRTSHTVLLVVLGALVVFGAKLYQASQRVAEQGSAAAEQPLSSAQAAEIEAAARAASDAMRRDDVQRAVALMDPIAQYYEDSLPFQQMYAEAALRAKRAESASRAVERSGVLAPDDPLLAIHRARLATLQGETVLAHELAEKALVANPGELGALWLAARSAERAGNLDRGIELWTRVVSEYPGNPDAVVGLSQLLWRSGQKERADSTMLGVVESQPAPSPRLQMSLHHYYLATGRLEEAVGAMRRAVELAPNDVNVGRAYAMSLLNIGRNAEAYDVAVDLSARFPGDAASVSILAIAAAQVNESNVARSAFEEWRELEPGNPVAASNYGRFLWQSGRIDEAREVFEAALTDSPGAGVLWLNYADLLRSEGETEAAGRASAQAERLLTPLERAQLVR